MGNFVTEEDTEVLKSGAVEFTDFTPNNIGLHKKLHLSFKAKRQKIAAFIAKTRKRIQSEEKKCIRENE